MFKNLLFFLLFTLSIFAQYQVSSYQATGSSIRFEVAPDLIPLASLTDDIRTKMQSYYDESRPGELALPTRSIFVALPPGAKVTVTHTIKEKSVEDFNPSINPEASLTKDTTIDLNFELRAAMKPSPKDPVEILGYFDMKGVRIVHLRLNQYNYNISAAKLETIKRIELNLVSNQPIMDYNSGVKLSETAKQLFNGMVVNPEAAPKFAAFIPSSDTTGNWIDYTASYVKIGVAKDGIYRVYGSDLQTYGVNLAEIQPATLQLLKKGKQQPVYVFGGSDNSFDAGDYIEFIGERNMGDPNYRTPNAYGQPYNEYFDRFTDTTIYWVTWNRGAGERVATAPQTLGVASDTLKYYHELVHQEQDRSYLNFDANLVRRELPYFYENKTLYWQSINAPTAAGSRTYTFNISELSQYDSVRFFSRLASGAATNATAPHSLVMQVGSRYPTYDSTAVNRYERTVLNGTAPVNFFTNGNNTLKVISYPTTGNTINTVWVDWVEMEYPRNLKATNDSLVFRFPYTATNDVKFIQVTNTTSDSLMLWKKGASLEKIFVQRSGSNLIIQDTVSASDKYFLVKNSSVLKPVIYYKKNWKNLRSPQNSAEYLAVSVQQFFPSLRPHLGFIKNSSGLDTFLVDMSDVYDEFSYGYFSTEALREFLRTTQTRWQSPYPDYLLLAGSAAWDYRLSHSTVLGIKFKKNLVPSYGSPLSDNLLSVFDSTSSYIPQLVTGRIPAKTVDDLDRYLGRLSTYHSERYDLFNKRALLLSGGGEEDQMNQFRTQHESIAANLLGNPYGQQYRIYFRTLNPPTFYGPFPIDEVDANIKLGGVLISYVGHSGTFFWDNGVTTPSQLQNTKRRGTLITDFGCSTGRFGEPDVDCFGEQFTLYPTGTAIGYISNSSYGFTSTASVAPNLFYESIFKDSVWQGATALRLAKVKMIQQFGNSSTNQLFSMTNTYFGDPSLQLKIPPKSNFFLGDDAITINPKFPSDLTDSIDVNIIYYNYGTVVNDTLSIQVRQLVNGVGQRDTILTRLVPQFRDSLKVKLSVKGLVGENKIIVNVNPNSRIDEIYTDDNEATYNFLISSSTTRDYLKYENENVVGEFIYFLTPGDVTGQQQFTVQFSESPSFETSVTRAVPYDTFYTRVQLDFLPKDKRYYFRVKDAISQEYGEIRSFYKSDKSGFGLYDSVAFVRSDLSNLTYNNGGVKLFEKNISIGVGSAGYYDGNSAYINYRGNNLFVGGTALSHNVAVFKAENMELLFFRPINLTFGDYNAELTAYKNILDTLDESEIIVIATAHDPVVRDAALRTKLKQFGSVYIDSVQSRDSWFMIGRKNAIPGSVPEQWKKKNTGMISFDTTFVFFNQSGRFVSNSIGPVNSWEKLFIQLVDQDSSAIFVKILGESPNGKIDSTGVLQVINGEVDLNVLNSDTLFNRARIIVDFLSYNKRATKSIKGLFVQFKDLTEVGVNTKSISLTKDTLKPDELVSGTVKIFNGSPTIASNFTLKVSLEGVGSLPVTILQQNVDRLEPFSSKSFQIQFRVPFDIGSKQLSVSLDGERKLREYFTDNNIAILPVFIQGDSSKPVLTMTIDGEDKPDGEFVSSNPNIKVDFFEFSPSFVQDTTLVQMFINGSRVFFASPGVSYSFQNTNPKISINYLPTLSNGDYDFTVIGRSTNSGITDTVSITKRFIIMKEPKLLNVYNYPNPFSNDTYFTFKLTQIPEELKILVYTVAGRKIRSIDLPQTSLRYDLNKIYWDGRDQDGDQVANGVYLYRIIMKKAGKTETITEKLAIIR